MARSRKSSRPATRAGGRRSSIACGARSLLLPGTAIRSAASSPRISSGAARSSRVARDAVCSSQPRSRRCCASCADARAPTTSRSPTTSWTTASPTIERSSRASAGSAAAGISSFRRLARCNAGTGRRGITHRCRDHAPDLAEQLREALSAAIDAALSPPPVAAMLLSGGLDSSVVAALASRSIPALEAVSACFPDDPQLDETAWAGQVADHIGVRLTTVPIERREPLQAAARYLDAWQLPLPVPGIFIDEQLLATAQSHGATVAIDGQGGDELFGASHFLISDYLRRFRVLAAWRLARRNAWGGSTAPRRQVWRRADPGRRRGARCRPCCTRSLADGALPSAMPRHGCGPSSCASTTRPRIRGAGSSWTGPAGGPGWRTRSPGAVRLRTSRTTCVDAREWQAWRRCRPCSTWVWSS